VAAHLTSARRAPLSLEAQLDADLDEALLAKLIEVERECCPFFELRYDASRRVFTVAVLEPAHAPALDAIAHALGNR
jgi:hypothetical protein